MTADVVDVLAPVGAAVLGAVAALLAAKPSRSAFVITEIAEYKNKEVARFEHLWRQDRLDDFAPRRTCPISRRKRLVDLNPYTDERLYVGLIFLLDSSELRVVHGSLVFERGETAQDVFASVRDIATVPPAASVTFSPEVKHTARLVTDTFAIYIWRHVDALKSRSSREALHA